MAIQCAGGQTSTLAKLAPPHTAAHKLSHQFLNFPTGRSLGPWQPFSAVIRQLQHRHDFANGVLVRRTNKKTNIWRVDADGSNPKRLTSGVTDVGGICSADGEWVYYYNLDSFQTLRVPIDGGNPEEVPGTGGLFDSTGLGLSSDGKLLAFFTPSKDPRLTVGKLVLVPLNAGPKPQVTFLDPDWRFAKSSKFTPDGKGRVYVIHEKGADNLWLQPLDGSGGRQITAFQDEAIHYYLFSPDGKSLGVMRTHTESDVVLLRDTGPSAQ